MSVYVIAQISITDRERYNRYQARFLDVFRQFKGRLLAADEAAEVVEGEWSHEKVILMQFPDKAAFEEWAFSSAYREIAKDRRAGSEGVVLLVEGFN
jgi:uncharacterized protein (DUF1330 family)